MLKYCVRCEEPIKKERKRNKIYCSNECWQKQQEENRKNDGLGPKEYKGGTPSIYSQGMDEGGLPWQIQIALDLEENISGIYEDSYYIRSCLEEMGTPTYKDGTRYKKVKTNLTWEGVYQWDWNGGGKYGT